MRRLALVILFIALCVASTVQAWSNSSNQALKRGKNIYFLEDYDHKDYSLLMKNIRKQVRGKRILTESGEVTLAEPIKSVRLNKSLSCLEVDSTGQDFDRLVEAVLDPHEARRGR